MHNIASHIAFVKKQAARLEEILAKHPDDKRAKYAYRPLIQNFTDLAKDLGELWDEHERQEALINDLMTEKRQLIEALEAAKADLADRRSTIEEMDVKPADLDGLPEAVLEQLGIGESERQEFALLRLFEEAGGTLSLDKLIIKLWHTTKEAHDRAKLNARLYRMAQKKMLHAVPDKRAVYTIYPQTKQEEATP